MDNACAMGDSDPLLSYLKSFGYSVVRLPRTDLRPLQLLVRADTRLTRLGDLSVVLQPGGRVPAPVLTENVAAANISGERTRDLSLGVGLSILGSVIGAMGGSTVGLDTGYKNAKTTSFRFTDVREDRVDLLSLDQYLGDADVNPLSTYAAQLLDADAIYVITSTIKTSTVLVDAKDAGGASVDLKVPEIQGVVGGSVKVSAASGGNATLAYEGPVPLVFGFQAARLFYTEGRYTAFKALQPGDAALEARASTADPRAEYLQTDSPFARLDP
jgi:hypothetical protein